MYNIKEVPAREEITFFSIVFGSILLQKVKGKKKVGVSVVSEFDVLHCLIKQLNKGSRYYKIEHYSLKEESMKCPSSQPVPT